MRNDYYPTLFRAPESCFCYLCTVVWHRKGSGIGDNLVCVGWVRWGIDVQCKLMAATCVSVLFGAHVTLAVQNLVSHKKLKQMTAQKLPIEHGSNDSSTRIRSMFSMWQQLDHHEGMISLMGYCGNYILGIEYDVFVYYF